MTVASNGTALPGWKSCRLRPWRGPSCSARLGGRPGCLKQGGPTMADSIELVRDKNVVASIAFQESVVYPTDALPGKQPERLVASDPLGRFHKVHHFAGNPDGTYEADSAEYWRELTEALAPAG